MKAAFRFALRDLRGSKAGLRLLAVCLFLGVAALAGIGSLSGAILGGLEEKGQVILGGDVEFETAQRMADPAERAAFGKAGQLSETIRMRAMASTENGSAAVLAELKGVDAGWPLYGSFALKPGALSARFGGNDVAVAPELLEKLDLKIGQSFRMGEASYRIMGVIAEEPDRVGEGFTLGPVVLTDLAGMNASGLIQPGSLFTAKYRIRIGASAEPETVAESITKQFPEAGWEVTDRSNGAPGTRRFFERLGQFLALVGLAALAIAGIGVGNGITSWLDDKRRAIATFKVLGADSRTIFMAYLLELGMVAGVTIIAGLAVGAALPWAVVALAGDLIPITPRLSLYPLPLLMAALYGLLIALLFALAPLARARQVTAQILFRAGLEPPARPAPPVLAAMALVLALLIALAVGSAYEPKFAAFFVAGAAALLALLGGLGWLVPRIASHLPRPRAPVLRQALANLHRPGAQTERLVVAIGLGLTLFATLAAIRTSFDAAIASTIPEKAPSFFALDIPKEEEARFRSVVEAEAPGSAIKAVPSLRGPVVAIKGQRVSEMKNIPNEAWFLRGDRGLTFARDLPEGSRLVEGKWWAADYAGPPLVSIDVQAAEAAGLKIGDSLTVSVLGVELEAQIASLREIDWDTMGFNYVLVFSPGSLDAAPYTVAATIAADPAREATLSRAVAQGFPQVSMIKVKDVLGQVSNLLGQLGQAIAIAALVAVAAGIAVLTGAVSASRRSRSYDAVLFKLLGATRRQVLAVQALEYGALAIVLGLVALLVGGGAGWLAVTQLFELPWNPDWGVMLATISIGALVTLGLGLIGSLPVLAARPAEALREL